LLGGTVSANTHYLKMMKQTNVQSGGECQFGKYTLECLNTIIVYRVTYKYINSLNKKGIVSSLKTLEMKLLNCRSQMTFDYLCWEMIYMSFST
jgi:hypothetical protein